MEDKKLTWQEPAALGSSEVNSDALGGIFSGIGDLHQVQVWVAPGR